MSAPSNPPAVGAVAIWGSGDLPGLGDQVLGRVIEQELLARLPGWRISMFAALGWDRPSRTDGGLVIEPLGRPEPARIDQLAAEATLSVLCPAFPLGLDAAGLRDRYGEATAEPFFAGGLGGPAERRHPVLATGVRIAGQVPPALVELAARAPLFSVRDTGSRDLLHAAGVERDIPVVPHPGVLLDRVADAGTFATRERQLRQLGYLPESGGYVVLAAAEPDELDLPAIRSVLTEDETLVVLPVADTGGIKPDQPDLHSVPDDLVFEDRLAILAGARAVIATDEHGAAVAAGLGCAWTLVDPGGAHRAAAAEFGPAEALVTSFAELARRPVPPRPAAGRSALRAQLDQLAELAERTRQDRGGEPNRRIGALADESRALRAAHWRQRERLLVERERLAEPLAAALVERHRAGAELDRVTAERDELRRRTDELTARLAECERELTAWQNIRLVRWTRPLRTAYGRVRSR